MPKFKLKEPVLHDGVRYEIGEEIDLEAKQAKALGDAVEPTKTAAKETQK